MKIEINEYLLKLFHLVKDLGDIDFFWGKAKLSRTEFRILWEVANEQCEGRDIISSELARRIGITRSAVSQIVAKLEKNGIVKRVGSEYDRKIAYTSQLAHIVSNAYVKSPAADGFPGFTGGSFQDMTRVAPVDENVWAELYMLNRENLLGEIDRITDRLNKFRAALAAGDEASLRTLQREGKECFRMYFKKN